MKALVLSYDDNHFLADHMIATYNRHWPSHPFVFHVPYQENREYLENKYGDRVVMVRSPKSIVETMRLLVRGINPDEWVYWAIDDKFLIDMDVRRAELCHEWVTAQRDESLEGLVTHRAWALWSSNVEPADDVSIGDQPLLRRRRWENFWLHQYYRARAVQDMVGSFSREPAVAKEMDQWVKRPIEQGRQLYVVENGIAIYGESASRGQLTRCLARSLKKYGIGVPATRVVKGFDPRTLFGKKLNLLQKYWYCLR